MQKIFIIHGWTYTLDAWKDCERELRALGIEPVFLKVPGLTSPSEAVWDVPKYVAWLDGQLAGETDIVLAGHSNGGRIAIAYAAKKPAALKKLILIDAAGIVHSEASLQAKRKIFAGLSKVGKPLSKIPFLSKIYYRLIGANDYGRATANMRETMKNLITTDLCEELPKISLPALILWGAKDAATPLSDGQLMHMKISGSELKIFPDAAHSPHKTHPKEIAEAIASFVR